MHNGSPSLLSALTRASTPEFLAGFGVPPDLPGHALLDWLFWPLAERFATLAAAFDAQVGAYGLPAAADWLLQRTVRSVEVVGRGHVPASGPLLVVANHPGLVDAPALFAALGRADLRVVAAERPFLRALPHLGRHVVYVADGDGARRDAVRAVVAHLRQGAAVLTFPAGRIEPDPAVLPGAAESLRGWSPSIGLFLRLAPETVVLPAVVRGVLAPAALRNPLTRLRRARQDREWLAALLQILVPAYQGVAVQVAFSPVLRAPNLRGVPGEPGADPVEAGGRTHSARRVTGVIIAHMRELLDEPPSVPAWSAAGSARAASWRARLGLALD